MISCNWSRSQPCALYIRCIVLLLMNSSESPRVQCSGSSLGRRFVRVFRFVDHPSSYHRGEGRGGEGRGGEGRG